MVRRKLDVGTLRRVAFFLDGLRYAFGMAEIAIHRLQKTLPLIVRKRSCQRNAEKLITAALLDTWSILDNCQRARRLIDHLPGFPKNSPEIRHFLKSTESVKKLRDYAQHFDEQIARIPLTWSPLWGSLSWIPSDEKFTCHTIFPGNLIDGVTVPSIAFDRHEMRFVAAIQLSTGVAQVDLMAIGKALETLRKFIVAWIEEHPQISLAEQSDTPVLGLSVVPKP